MYDIDGNRQVYLVDPIRVDRVIPKMTPIKTIEIGTYKTWYTCDINGRCGFIKMSLNLEQAKQFAKHNELKIINDYMRGHLWVMYLKKESMGNSVISQDAFVMVLSGSTEVH